ncbi:TPA: hypothetical protein N0F65_002758 [Lagenidium giganteum]|uniref:PH domain-containing protein n=1 Tax=Lagenidium giganteum TaxID=4803 RepID=A0AAV2YK48_9STRA|nr:TPA: hypothetical protein N0F65_002758 [Lagenidium giganteum]
MSLALLYNMNGDHDKAIPLLHKRLVIHEKFGPDELVGETLQDIGTTYRLQGSYEIALQHLERALAIREKCHGENSFKVAESINSISMLYQIRNDSERAEEYQLRSLQVLFESSEPEDIESEDVPWEVYKRLKQQRGPTTAQNSVTLLKGNLRKCVMEAVYQNDQSKTDSKSPMESPMKEKQATNNDVQALESQAPQPDASMMNRITRAQSDSALRLPLSNFPQTQDRLTKMDSVEEQRAEPMVQTSATPLPPRARNRSRSPVRSAAARDSHSILPPPIPTERRVYESISDFGALQHRVEVLKRRISGGYAEVDTDIARLASDVDLIPSRELRQVGMTMVALVREMNRLGIKSDNAKQLPVLEGMLEKKSASIFRGWEKRWFKVDPKTFILSYHFSKDDHGRGFAPRGGFPVSRISNILVHRHARGGHCHFDIVVDLSTRLNPHASRTYELRCESEDTVRYWVETLHHYKAMAQSSQPRPSTS